MKHAWKLALALVALAATVMALYVQIFERRSRQEEERLSAARLERALGEARLRLKAEILAELRAELAKPAGEQGDRPLPNAVLRRGESGGRVEQQLLAPGSAQATPGDLQQSLDSLAFQMERNDRATRREVEELRAELRREQEASAKTVGFLLAALVPLVIHLLASAWPRGSTSARSAPDRSPD